MTAPADSVTRSAGVDPRWAMRYLVLYVLVLHAAPFLNMLRAGAVPVFVVVNLVSVYSLVIAGRYLYGASANGAGLSSLDIAVMAYVAYCAGSFLLYLQPGNPAPLSTYAYGVYRLLLPIPLFFAVKTLTSSGRSGLIRWICVLNIWLVVIGVILFFARPTFYGEFLRRYYSATTVEPDAIYARMGSYLGSTAVGMLAAVTVVLLPMARLGSVLSGIGVAVMVIGAALAQQRGGFVATLIAVMYYVVASQGRRLGKAVTIVIGAALVGGIAIWVSVQYKEVFQLFFVRLAGVSEALGERAYSYVRALAYFRDFPFGLGLGATSPTDSNLAGEITDGNFARIFADLGPLGLLLFLNTIVVGAYRALQSQRKAGFLVLLLIYCLVAMGTNDFDTYYVGHLFWILLGVLDREPLAQVMTRTPVRSEPLPGAV